MKCSVLLSVFCCILPISHGLAASETLVYAVVHKGSDYRAVKTEIREIDSETAATKLVFTDEKTSILLLQHLYVFSFPVAAGGKLFAHAADRNQALVFPGNGSLYELTIGGGFRQITPILGGESLGDTFANSTGTRIAYVNRMKRRRCVFVHDTATGKLIHQIDVTNKFLDSSVSSIGWIPGRNELYVSLEATDAGLTSAEPQPHSGTFFMEIAGSRFARIPTMEGLLPPGQARMIGVLPDGRYILETMQFESLPSSEQGLHRVRLMSVSNDFSTLQEISFTPESSLYAGVRVRYQLSPSGRYLSAASLPVSADADACDIWLKDLKTGDERKLLSYPSDGLNGPFVGPVGWLTSEELSVE